MKWLTNPVDIRRGRIWKIVIDHTVDTFEIHSSSNNVSGDQNPCFPGSEVIDRIVTLRKKKKFDQQISVFFSCWIVSSVLLANEETYLCLRQVRVDYIDSNVIRYQLSIEFLGSLLALDENQYRRIQTLLSRAQSQTEKRN